ncbi:cadherin-like beta sandwich domain-containing protein [Mucilaginibacter sp.]|uniref:cadherin-like beta sandwich domain-containing protein n=1 Tax=Mucilaginibacter sp. TaxID=1882438 RepID=UPI0025E227FC|nr:cadherin-like beta sandwich domain-containing protein [Mucilaginibacter sp.]
MKAILVFTNLSHSVVPRVMDEIAEQVHTSIERPEKQRNKKSEPLFLKWATAKVFNYRVHLLMFAASLCFSGNLFAVIKPVHKYPRLVSNHVTKVNKQSVDIKPDAAFVKLKTNNAALVPTISYTGPQTYTAGTAITPLVPTSSGVAAVAYSSNPAIVASRLNSPSGIAVDRWGNVFVINENVAGLTKYPASGGAAVTLTLFLGDYATAVTTDVAGNLYVYTKRHQLCIKMSGEGKVLSVLNSEHLRLFGYKNPVGLAVDDLGNIYSVAPGIDVVQQAPPSYRSYVKLGSELSNARSVAVDVVGNVYVADFDHNAIKMFPAAGAAAITLGSGFKKPTGVAVDAAGNVFVADYGNNAVKEIPAGGGVPVTLASGFLNPTSVAVGSDGNIYITDRGHLAVKKIRPAGGYYVSPALPAGLFINNSTGVITGTPTGSSPATQYTISAYNVSGSSSATVTIGVNLPALPVVSYGGAQTYTMGAAIKPLAPASTGVGAVGYSRIPILFNHSYYRDLFVDGVGNVYQILALDRKFLVTPPDGGPSYFISFQDNNWGQYASTVDPAGNIYLASQHKGMIKIPAGGGAWLTLTTDARFKDALYDFTADAKGNIYAINFTDRIVIELPAGGGSIINACVGAKQPFRVQVDSAGNIYTVEDIKNSIGVVKYPVGGGSPVVIESSLSSGNAGLGDIGVDGSGNLYVIITSLNLVKKIPADGGKPIVLSSGFDEPTDIVISGNGRLYVEEFSQGDVKEIIPTGGYFITPHLPGGLHLDEATGIISGKPTAVSPAKNYVIHAYNLSGETRSVINIKVSALPAPAISYGGPVVFATGAAITPLVPTASRVAAPGYSSATTTVGSGFLASRSVSLDAAGNIYVADHGNKQVKKVPVGGTAPYAIGKGLADPNGVAADAAGNVYVADNGNNTVKRITTGGNTDNIGFGFAGPTGVAVDAAGSVYVSDNLHSMIRQVPAGLNTSVALGTGFSNPYNVAVDAAGTLYISDSKNNALKKLPAGSNTPVTIGSGYSSPNGVAVDAFGNVFLTDFGNNLVRELPAGGGSLVTIGSGFSAPYGLATDAVGNVYVADQNNNAVKKIAPVGGYYVSPALPAGLSINHVTGVIRGVPTAPCPATDYKITAYNANGSSTAIVNITTTASVNLANLVLSYGTLSPAFNSSINKYTANVPNTTSGITVTPTVTQTGATVKINGIAITDGTTSGNIPLKIGPNTITVIATSADGKSVNTYTIKVSRIPFADDGLVALALNSGALSPAFTKAITNYTANVSTTTTTIHITPVTSDVVATIKVNGVDLLWGATSADIPLIIGSNRVVVTVTAQDGITIKNYVVTVIRAKSGNAFLSTLKADGKSLFFRTTGPGYADYTTAIDPSKSSISITPAAVDSNATITINGVAVATGTASAPVALNPTSTLVTILVTAQNGIAKKTYTLRVERTGSLNAFLKSLKLSPNSELVATNGTGYYTTSFNYTATVAPEVSNLIVTPAAQDPNAAITVNGTIVNSGEASTPISLNAAPTNITITVTSQAGTTSQIYTVTVNRSGSNNALLTSLKLINYYPRATVPPLTMTTGPGYKNFKTTIVPDDYYLRFIPTAQDANATITVNDTPVISGKSSEWIRMNIGDNLVTTVVTAQDGITKKVYLIAVHRLNDAGLAANDSTIVAVIEEQSPKPTGGNDIIVQSGFSPNGDGINDYLVIDGLAAYPENKLSIAARSGALVYETTGYNSRGNVFDGHAKNGRLQQAGTYFYKLEYKTDGVTKRKTGFTVIKY